MGREFYLGIEAGGNQESIELFYGRERCADASYDVFYVSSFSWDTETGCLFKNDIERLSQDKDYPFLKDYIKDDKQEEYDSPKFYNKDNENDCAVDLLINAIKLIYFHQLPSEDYFAHCVNYDCDLHYFDKFRDMIKTIKEKNLDFKIYLVDSLWYDVFLFVITSSQVFIQQG